MVYGKAEDAGGLSPAKDDNAAVRHFIRRTLPILGRVDYKMTKEESTVKKYTKPLPFLLVLALLLSMNVVGAGAAFSDVPIGSWYEQGVETCAGDGIMTGTGDGLFSPDKELTRAECLTLAFRIYDLTHGTEHTVETAPEDWGRLTLTLADGTVFSGYGYNSDVGDGFEWWSYRNGDRGVYVRVPGWSYEDMTAGAEAQRAWMDAHSEVCDSDAPAALTLNGVTYQGTAHCCMPVGPYVLLFQPESDEADEVNAILHHAVYRETGPDRWWRDICYTVARRELEDIFDPYDFNGYTADRGFFARALATGCGEGLEKRFEVEAIPDLPREENGTQADNYRAAAYTLYEAGILTGIDDAGTFDAEGTLTRAQAAVTVARVLDEDQRATWLAVGTWIGNDLKDVLP